MYKNQAFESFHQLFFIYGYLVTQTIRTPDTSKKGVIFQKQRFLRLLIFYSVFHSINCVFGQKCWVQIVLSIRNVRLTKIRCLRPKFSQVAQHDFRAFRYPLTVGVQTYLNRLNSKGGGVDLPPLEKKVLYLQKSVLLRNENGTISCEIIRAFSQYQIQLVWIIILENKNYKRFPQQAKKRLPFRRKNCTPSAAKVPSSAPIRLKFSPVI